jgi:hypothetical protein
MRHTLLLSLSGLILSASLAPASAATETRKEAAQIDALLQADWSKNKLQANPKADDPTFLRRIYLDVIGRIPTTRETETFLASQDPEKRAKLIDHLLASEGYVQHAFNYWADVLRAQSNGPQAGAITGAAYTTFLKDSLRENRPYHQLVRDLVAAQGRAWDNGAIGYYMRDRGMPLDNMANTVRIFLGTRIECAQCHNHPFDKWTQMEFFQMAAYSYDIETQDYNEGTVGEARDLMRAQETAIRANFKEPERPRKTKEMSNEEYRRLEKAYEKKRQEVRAKQDEARAKLRQEQRNYQESLNDIRDTMRYTSVGMRNRKVTLPHDYQYSDAKPKSVVEPKTMMGHDATPIPGETPLQAYARWMASPENPRFNTVIANRLWKKAFGLALIEPLDELMDTTVPMIPEVQKHIEKLIVSVNYDMKAFLRILFNTQAYQSQVTRDEIAPGTIYHFTGPVLRRMTAEQMWDSFVTLINPDPDMPNVIARETMEQRVLQAKKNADAIEALTAEELLDGVKLAAAVYAKNRERTEAKQKLYIQARIDAKAMQDKAELLTGADREAAEEKARQLKKTADSLRSEVNTIQNEGRRTTMAEVIVPGQKKLFQEVTGKAYPSMQVAAAPTKQASPEAGASMMMSGDSSSMMMSAYGGRVERITIPGYDREELSAEEKKLEASKRDAAFAEEATYFGIPDKDRKNYFRARSDQMRNYLRAAEIESPAPRGHYLREFGQSDRETIENANYEASVPQALAMMNGQLMPQILSRYSQLMLTLNKATYPDEQVDAAYLTILARKPTAKEKQIWLQAQDKGLTSMEDLVYSLLNTQQFIFVQ